MSHPRPPPYFLGKRKWAAIYHLLTQVFASACLNPLIYHAYVQVFFIAFILLKGFLCPLYKSMFDKLGNFNLRIAGNSLIIT